MKVSVLAVVAALPVVLAGCTDETSDDARLPPVASVPPHTRPSDAPAVTFAPLRCSTPTDSLVRRTLDVFAVGDGSVTASTLVPAVTTQTGNWYVIGLDQDIKVKDGTVYPDKSLRSLAVTDADARHAKVIRLGNVNDTHGPISWRRVSWAGETLTQGERAVAKAAACLDRDGT